METLILFCTIILCTAVGIALGATCIILAIRVTPGASLYPTW